MTFYIESKGWLSPDLSGFRKRRGTMDPVICLETEIIYKSVVADLFDVEKAYDMVCKEGLLITSFKMRIKGRTLNCVKETLL